MKKRCDWVPMAIPIYVDYHDYEWGVPLHDDGRLFEFLVLDTFQAGLSWLTILKKRDNFRRVFMDFDAEKIAVFDQQKVAVLCQDAGIIRNHQKIEATIQNAQAFLTVQREFGSFNNYIWQFVGDRPMQNAWKTVAEIPAKTVEAETVSKDLVKRGFRFVGPTICYAFMQAAGLVNDHLVHCFRYHELGSTIKINQNLNHKV